MLGRTIFGTFTGSLFDPYTLPFPVPSVSPWPIGLLAVFVSSLLSSLLPGIKYPHYDHLSH
jgi:hypothetical protein